MGKKLLAMLLGMLTVLFITNFAFATIIHIPEDYSTIQAGISASTDEDTVLVNTGIYVENINYNGKNITVASKYITTLDTSYISQTIIDGDSVATVVSFVSSEDSTAVLSGFTITNGKGFGNPDRSGGGITCKNSSSPNLENLMIVNSDSDLHGGGIYCHNSSPSLRNITIIGNNASSCGGGIHLRESNLNLENITITNNNAGYGGGGIFCSNSSMSLENVVIDNNYSEMAGGIYSTWYSSISLENVTITDNSHAYYGAAGGVYNSHWSNITLVNCILWNDTPPEIMVYLSSSISVNYSDVQGVSIGIEVIDGTLNWGEGNIDVDPLFMNPENGDYHLTATSPCIDAGDPTYPIDPDGTITDMGAFYYHQDTTLNDLNGTITDDTTGNGVENAQITLTGQGITHQEVSDENGYYEFNDLLSGQYNITVSADGYQSEGRSIFLQGGNSYTVNFELVPLSGNFVQLTNEQTMYADAITTIEPNYYTLSGNVNINQILNFDGEVTVDKRASLNHPEISFSCGYYVPDIEGSDYVIKDNDVQATYYAVEDHLSPKSFEDVIDGSFGFGGFSVTIGELIIDPTGMDVEVKAIVEMAFPINKVFEYFSKNNSLPMTVETLSGSVILSQVNGIEMAADISGLGCNLGIFSLSDVNLYFDTNEDVFGGGFMLNIPGEVPGRGQKNLNSKKLDSVPVRIQNEAGELIRETTFKDFVELQRSLGTTFLGVGMQIEFVSGAINTFIITVQVDIPIAQTGLFITEITGGIEDLQTPDWRIIANVDVETGIEVPVLGSPIKLDDFGVEVCPITYFKGGGAFLIFDNEVSNGFIEYDGSLLALSGEGNLDLADIVVGSSNFTLESGSFKGGGNVTIKTPSDLPYFLNWAENMVLGSAEIDIHNTKIQSNITISDIEIAMELVFGKEDAPYFNYSFDTNYNPLDELWEGYSDGRQVIEFVVKENTKQIILVAGNDINLFDFYVTNPDSVMYDSTNTTYAQYENSIQTVMIIDYPMSGNWKFHTEQTDDITFKARGLNQAPTALVNNPETRKTRDTQVTLNFTDYADTLTVEVFYDTDNRNFDGVSIQEFELINNATIDFNWQNSELQNGEYFIYSRISDGKNAPVLQYAPGSILVENDLNVETPQNLNATQISDSIKVEWDAATWNNTFATTVYFKNISTNFIDEISIYDTNSVYIKDLKNGQEYDIWCCFLNNVGTLSPKSNVENIVFTSNLRNNPPYFTMNPDSVWDFVVGEQKAFTLSANDADGESLTFDIPQDTLGMQISGNSLFWTPTEDQKGVYDILLTVSDGTDLDSLMQEIIVYTAQQVEIALEFSSKNLYENDNMFIKLNNYYCSNIYQDVTLQNVNTTDQINVQCRKVNKFEYIGKFGLSFRNRSILNVSNGDTIRAFYNFNATDYFVSAYYDSLAQPSDNIPPADITDLLAESIPNNQVKLVWTAPGDNGDEGQAFKYDIRYAFEEIATEDAYFVAHKIAEFPYPSPAGETDSLLINLTELDSTQNNEIIYFSVKTEDANQNRSGLSNCANANCFITPQDFTAEIIDVFKVNLNWSSLADHFRDSTGFQSFKIQRQYDDNSFTTLTDSLAESNYIDDLFSQDDGDYKYGLQAIYSQGESDTVFSNTVNMDRFINVRILCALSDTTNYENIHFLMNGQDSIYAQNYDYTTNLTGLVLMNSVYKTEYALEISKFCYETINDTISITDENNIFNYILSKHAFNLQAQISDSILTLEWDEMDGAAGYKIYTADNAVSGFQDVTDQGTFSGTSWSISITGVEKKFYYVTAIQESEDKIGKNKR